jgi:hypothetical protein
MHLWIRRYSQGTPGTTWIVLSTAHGSEWLMMLLLLLLLL